MSLPQLAGALIGALLLLLGGLARAQVTASPDSLRVALAVGEEATHPIELANAGGGPLSYCLDFDRPLQRAARAAHSSHGAGCSPPGDVLNVFDESDLGDGWIPYGITMTPEGRVFVAESVGSRRTFELTSALEYVREFDHPVVLEVGVTHRTAGVTYNQDTATLWWTNIDRSGATINRVLLLEGDLNGLATGRRIEIPVPPPTAPGGASGSPSGATYDTSRKRYYYADLRRDEIWAIDTLGVVVPGYPVSLARYPSGFLGFGVDTHPSDGGPSGVRLEVVAGLMLDLQYDRVVVTDTGGANLNLETPLGALVGGLDGPIGTSVRSRLDPNGVMYVPFFEDDGNHGIAAIRPVPLSPTWLTLSDWTGTIPAGGTSEVMLTFRAGQRAPGEYRSTLVVEDTAGVVLASVPLTLVVEPGTPAEPGPETESGVRLVVSPNPITTTATATITLAAPASDVTVTVNDVLGRQMTLVHRGALPAGDTPLALDARSLPAGVYVVRALVDGAAVAQRITVLR